MTTTPDDFDPTLDAARREMSDVRLSDEARARIARRLARESGGGAQPAGSTTLRAVPRSSWRYAAWAMAAAACLFLLMWIARTVDRNTAVSAAEVLVRSQQALSARTSGIETISYDLWLEGVLQQLLPEPQAGRFVVEETIDHDHPGRLRLRKFTADGQLAAGAADDPVTRTRVRYMRLGNRGMLLRFANVPSSPLALSDARRVAIQVLLGLMQTSTNPSLTEVTADGEPAYEIVVPPLAAAPGSIALDQGRAVIRRDDARVVEFHAAGRVGAQPFAVSFTMLTRDLRGPSRSDANLFTIAPQPGDEVIDADGAAPLALWDAIGQCLRR